jgi:hypothetical protein
MAHSDNLTTIFVKTLIHMFLLPMTNMKILANAHASVYNLMGRAQKEHM